MINGIVDYPLQNIIDVHNFIFEDLIYIFLLVVTCYTSTIKDFEKGKFFLRNHPFHVHSHNTWLEVIWTIIPSLFILLFMYPSMALLYLEENVEKSSIVTVNVIGNQWYWVYDINTSLFSKSFTSNLVTVENFEGENPNAMRLLATNESLILPVGIKSSIYITSNDVAHSWCVPALGVKVDAIPGRINLKEITPTMLGMYSGMCSELCGVEHGFMPISLQIVTIDEWINSLTKEGTANTNIDNFFYFKK